MVGKYVSLEAKIARHKDMYYAALRESSDTWYDESSCPISFIRYWLQMLLAAYHEFEDRSSILDVYKRQALRVIGILKHLHISLNRSDIENKILRQVEVINRCV